MNLRAELSAETGVEFAVCHANISGRLTILTMLH